ncbi:MAG: cobalamin B12-binding domain-containing protein [Firmicutes bacterium]|nr:cobalamin B12-binding domain-containing protein [Bacillota bacterium]
MMAAIFAFNVLKNRDEGSAAFIERYQNCEAAKAIVPKGTAKAAKAAAAPAPAPAGGGGTGGGSAADDTATGGGDFADGLSEIAYAVDRGLEGETAKAVEKLLQKKEAMAIVNEDLIPALDRVGQGFEKGDIFLPSMMQSAQAAQAGFDVIKKHMDDSGEKGESQGDVVIATVKGDVHDIGKNIVKVIMENYGFNMIDLGRDVPVEDVVKAVVDGNVKLVGLSALMTTTLASMKETIAAVKAAAPDCKVMVGGAVLTEDYAAEIGADFYCKDAMKSVEAAQKVFA